MPGPLNNYRTVDLQAEIDRRRELTITQLRDTLRNVRDELRSWPGAKFVWLIRRIELVLAATDPNTKGDPR